MKKITIIGDLICDKKMLNAARKKDYDFSNMFSPLKNYFSDSSYVIANLETSIASSNFSRGSFSFCNPPSFLDALKQINVSCVSLANNHILDRGIEGIENTILELKKRNIDYFGISNDLSDGVYNIDFDGVGISILGYTDSTNYHINKAKFDDSNYKVNVLKNTFVLIKRNGSFFKKMYCKLSPDIRLNIKNFFHSKLKPIVDNGKIDSDVYLSKISNIISNLKGRYIIMYPHMGGQYNVDFGNYTKEMIPKFRKMGCNSIVITHPHIIQNTYSYDNVFSIGGVIMSPKSNFVVWDTLPEFSMVVNYYFDSFELKKITVSFLICVSDKKSYLKVYPFYDFYNSLDDDCKKTYKDQFDIVFKRVFNRTDDVLVEYEVGDNK